MSIHILPNDLINYLASKLELPDLINLSRTSFRFYAQFFQPARFMLKNRSMSSLDRSKKFWLMKIQEYYPYPRYMSHLTGLELYKRLSETNVYIFTKLLCRRYDFMQIPVFTGMRIKRVFSDTLNEILYVSVITMDGQAYTSTVNFCRKDGYIFSKPFNVTPLDEKVKKIIHVSNGVIMLYESGRSTLDFERRIDDIVASGDETLILSDGHVYRYDFLNQSYMKISLPCHEKAIKISTHSGHSAILSNTGSVYKFGRNDHHQVSPDNAVFIDHLYKVPIDEKAVDVSCGGINTYIVSTHNIYIIANTGYHFNNIVEYMVKFKLLGIENIVKITAGVSYMAIITDDGRLHMHGANYNFPLEDRTIHNFMLREEYPCSQRISTKRYVKDTSGVVFLA